MGILSIVRSGLGARGAEVVWPASAASQGFGDQAALRR